MNDIFEFTDVSRPGMSPNQGLQGFRADLNISYSKSLRIDAEKVFHQQGDVAQALPQGGEVQAGNVQTIVQIFPEPAVVDLSRGFPRRPRRRRHPPKSIDRVDRDVGGT